MKVLPQPILDRFFRIAVTIKGLDGLLEVLGGLALIVVPVSKIQGIVATLAIHEISEDPHAIIANFILQLDHRINPHVQVFAVVYLLAHGLIKVFLAAALLREKYHWYPVAMGFLLAFIFYQSYRIGYDHSISLTILTLFDCLIVWLTYQEWRRHQGKSQV